jgi:hypothetical protein
MKVVSYEQARNVIQDGDFIFFKNGNSIWSLLTEAVTDSPIYHCGIAFWIRDPLYKSRLMVVEASNGGRRIVSLSSYAKHEMDVVASHLDWVKYGEPVLDKTGAVPYSKFEFIAIGLLEKFGIRRRKDDEGEVCSKMIAEYCKSAGVELPTTDISPAKLKTTLLALGFEERCTVTASI